MIYKCTGTKCGYTGRLLHVAENHAKSENVMYPTNVVIVAFCKDCETDFSTDEGSVRKHLASARHKEAGDDKYQRLFGQSSSLGGRSETCGSVQEPPASQPHLTGPEPFGLTQKEAHSSTSVSAAIPLSISALAAHSGAPPTYTPVPSTFPYCELPQSYVSQSTAPIEPTASADALALPPPSTLTVATRDDGKGGSPQYLGHKTSCKCSEV
jgi:hypothetical protein